MLLVVTLVVVAVYFCRGCQGFLARNLRLPVWHVFRCARLRTHPRRMPGLVRFVAICYPKLRAGDRVVDMATGTADVAIMISGELAKLERAASEEQGKGPETVYPGVVGIDPSARMLEVSFA